MRTICMILAKFDSNCLNHYLQGLLIKDKSSQILYALSET